MQRDVALKAFVDQWWHIATQDGSFRKIHAPGSIDSWLNKPCFRQKLAVHWRGNWIAQLNLNQSRQHTTYTLKVIWITLGEAIAA